MTRSRFTVALTLGLAIGAAQAIRADVRTDQRTKFQLAGVLGRVVNIFGGRGAREGVTSTVAVKGNRKLTMNDTTGQIVDLGEEKVYDLDMKKKTFKVTTFAEFRRRLEEAQRQAAEDAKKAQAREDKPTETAQKDPAAKEVELEVDFDVKNTDEKKTVNGFDTHRAIVTVAVREKGKTIEQSGGLIMTTDLWLAPRIPAMKELQDFDIRYAKMMAGPMVAGASPQDMAAAMAMYPQMKPALAKMAAEGGKIEGTPILTTVTMDAVKSAEQMAEEAKSGGVSSGSSGAAPTTVGGMLGGLARRGMKKEEKKEETTPSARVNFMTTTVEVLKLTTDVSAEFVGVPAGFKESK